MLRETPRVRAVILDVLNADAVLSTTARAADAEAAMASPSSTPVVSAAT
jgi:hypothetical protein